MIASTVFAVLACLIPSAVGTPLTSLLTRPDTQPWPYSPGVRETVSPPRDAHRYCFVKPSRKGGDDSGNILKAFHDCNHGGTVVLYSNYTVTSPLDLTFLEHIDVAITGTINFGTDLPYWTEHSFKYAYQDSSAFWRFGGKDVNIFGHGVGLINGNGQPWWDAAPLNSTLLRPILFVLDGLHGGSVTGLRMINPPNVSLHTGNIERGKKRGVPLLTRSTVVQPDRQQYRHSD